MLKKVFMFLSDYLSLASCLLFLTLLPSHCLYGAGFSGDFSQAGGSVYDGLNVDKAYSVAVDTFSGGGPYIYVVGFSSNGTTGSDFFTIKYNSSGSMIASATYNDSGEDIARDVAVDNSGNVYVTGYSYNNYFTIKYNSNLVFQSSAAFDGGNSGNSLGIAVDNTDNVYVTGTIGSGTTNDVVTIKYNTNLVFQSSAVFNGGNFDCGWGIAADNIGNVYVAGSTYNGGYNYLILKYNDNLVFQSSAAFNGGRDENSFGIVVDNTGNVFVTGQSWPGANFDCFTIKYNSNLVVQSSAVFNGGNADEGYDIASDNYGNIYVTGYSNNGANKDYVTIKYNSNLVFQSSAGFNGGGEDWGYGIAVDNSGNVYVTGNSNNGTNNDYRTIRYNFGVDNPPTVSISQPTDGATVSSAINFGATASDDVGITKVDFYVDDVLKNTDTSLPYSWSWDTTAYSNAAHILKVIAVDTSGQTATAQISVTVNNVTADNPPTVSISQPTDGATVSSAINFGATASDDVGITKVDFYVDDVLKNTDTSLPYSWSWDTTAYSNAAHILKVIAVDTSGQTATDQISVTVNNATADNPPTVEIKDPTDGITVNGTIKIKYKVGDDKGVTTASLYIDGMLRETLSDPNPGTYNTYDWNTLKERNGTHKIKVTATDTNSQTTISEITVTVSNVYTIISSTPTDIGISAEIKPANTVINPEKGQETKINFSVGGKTAQSGEIVHVTIAIYNARGELVKTLLDQDMPAGAYQTMWSGRNFEEDVVASGVYVVRLKAGNYTASKKLVVIK